MQIVYEILGEDVKVSTVRQNHAFAMIHGGAKSASSFAKAPTLTRTEHIHN